MTNSFTEEDVGLLLNLIEDVKQEGACRGVSAAKAIERLRVAWEYWQKFGKGHTPHPKCSVLGEGGIERKKGHGNPRPFCVRGGGLHTVAATITEIIFPRCAAARATIRATLPPRCFFCRNSIGHLYGSHIFFRK